MGREGSSTERSRASLAVALALAVLVLGCASGRNGARGEVGPGRMREPAPVAVQAEEGARRTGEPEVVGARGAEPIHGKARRGAPAGVEGEEPLSEWGEGWAGWRDGIGPGSPYEVPLSLDYFQGLLVAAGVEARELGNGRQLTPEQAGRLLVKVVEGELTVGNFAAQRMAVHLLLEVWEEGAEVTREELHRRLLRYEGLLVLRPDSYLVRPYTGQALQQLEPVEWAADGTLRAGRVEVGPFYAVEEGWLYPVDERFEVRREAGAVARYEPDEGLMVPAVEGALLAVVDLVEGVVQVVVHPVDTVEGLARLPGAVGELVRNSPEHWEEFRRKPQGERVRMASRLMASVLLLKGTAGVGSAKLAGVGSKLGGLTLPAVKLLGDGRLALQAVQVGGAGRALAAAGPALEATYVLHMAQVGASAVAKGGRGGGSTGGGGRQRWRPPVGGPGKWVEVNEAMSPTARAYQYQVTKVPSGWAYRVSHNGVEAYFDDLVNGILVDAKGPGYDNFFGADLKPKRWFQGAKALVAQAKRQVIVANGVPIRWHVAEPRMVQILKKLFSDEKIRGIEVVCTPFKG